MPRAPLAVLLAACLFTISGCGEPKPEDAPAPEPQDAAKVTPESVAVATLFERYRSGEPELSSYPELGWEDVPALLALADSAVLLESFPVNPFSSQWQETVPEGVLALWFVEGIRRNDPIGYPSLNPLLLPSGSDRGNWDDLSASSQPAAARAYREWWQAVQSDAEVREHDPLEDTGIGWYGAP